MIYYRVKKEFDQKPLFKFRRGGGLEIVGFAIADELYTQSEMKTYCGLTAFCERVEIPKSKIYFFFGARFAVE